MQGNQPQAPAFTPPAASTGTSPVATPATDLSQPPQNDDQLKSYLASAAPVIQSASGAQQKALSDTLYSNLANYAANNPGSTVARTALDAAHRNAPPGHTFPQIGQSNI